jgi:DnaJ family protein C protein 8
MGITYHGHYICVCVLLLQLKDETERAKEEHEEMKQQFKKQREHEKKWESTRDTRVGTWREYMNKGSKKKTAGHIKPPKAKTFDEDKTYVQRPVGEQHRPPPPKPAGPKK